MNKIIIIIVLISIIPLSYFVYLHIPKEKPKTEEDLMIREVLLNNRAPVVVEELEEEVVEEEPVAEEEVVEAEPVVEPEVVETEPKVNVIKEGEFNPDAEGSDSFHRGWGGVSVVELRGVNRLVFKDDFRVTNGPDYKVYLVEKSGVETGRAFRAIKSDSYRIGDLHQFRGYQTFEIPSNIDVDKIEGVVIWCEAFSQYISTADLR